MAFSAKGLKKHMARLKPILNNCSLDTLRKGQNAVGNLMSAVHRKSVVVKKHEFDNFDSAWVIPRDERRQGVILYIHGGGYTCGDFDYAKGFGTTLAVHCGVRVFCPAYRLAPEHKYPAALDDSLEAYHYLIKKGYSPSHITLCGESAGGGLCYALCLKLRELGEEMPCGIIAISPWTDMTASGESYETNKGKDPAMTAERLSYFANNYTTNRLDPFVSPLFGDISEMPPSLIFAGGDEIMLSDSTLMHEKLCALGAKSKIYITPERWHAYVVYDLRENREDFNIINQFLSKVMSKEHKLRWLRLDNAAKIYPAARRQNWSNVFRVSVTLNEEVDKEVLSAALDVTVRRFPSIAAKLRRGVFWFYLEQISSAPEILDERSYPLVRMSNKEMAKCAFRVLIYKRRIAVEFFHSLTDGTGATIFLKTLTAEYLQQKHGISIPSECGVLGRLEEPSDGELEDSFLKYSGNAKASRKENDAWDVRGTLEPAGFLHLTCLKLPVSDILAKAHEYNVSLTTFLCAVLMQALQKLQAETVPNIKRRKSIKVLLPVNLRKLFPSHTLRNFALYTTPEIEPKLGEYSFDEICSIVTNHMSLEITQKQMGKKIATNVGDERSLLIKLTPLGLKNIVMRMVFDAVGERKSCLSLSNLGAISLPEPMVPYIERFDFILGTQAMSPYNCGVLSFGDTLYINFIRNIREPLLELKFHEVLRDMGIICEVESNQQ